MQAQLARRGSVLQCEQLEDRLTPNATTFVTGLYNNLLNRAPDSSGLAHWVGLIQSGMSNAQVADGIWRSVEHRGIQVDAFYNMFLHRAADPAGRAFWINVLTSGQLDEIQVAGSFLTSNEYLFEHSTPDAFVTGLYLDVLARLPSNPELVNWENVLFVNGAGFVAAGLLTSPEAAVGIINNDYLNYLGRLPDPSGLDNWLSQLETNRASVESVAVGILGSAEYAAKH
jgi:hypothetical protein